MDVKVKEKSKKKIVIFMFLLQMVQNSMAFIQASLPSKSTPQRRYAVMLSLHSNNFIDYTACLLVT